MTIATCVFCGAEKWGSFNKCDSCGKRPTQELDLAYSLALSDHYFDHKILRRVGKDIEVTGQRPNLPPEQEKRFLKTARLYSNTFAAIISSQEAGDIEGARRRAAELEREMSRSSHSPFSHGTDTRKEAESLLAEELVGSGIIEEDGTPYSFNVALAGDIDISNISDSKQNGKFLSWWNLGQEQRRAIEKETGFDEGLLTEFLEPHIGIRFNNDGQTAFIDIWDYQEALNDAETLVIQDYEKALDGAEVVVIGNDANVNNRTLPRDIKQAFQMMNLALDEYVGVHDYLFAFKLRRIIPIPLIFEKVNYRKSSETLAGISERLDGAFQRLKEEELPDASGPLDYLSALRSEVVQLQKWAQKLSEKADGKLYLHRAYSEDLELYEALKEVVRSKGQRLNRWMQLHGHLTL